MGKKITQPKQSLDEFLRPAREARKKMGEAKWGEHLKEVYLRDQESIRRHKRIFDEFINSSEGQAREALRLRLEEISKDPVIKQSATCTEVIEAFLHCVTYRWGARDAAGMIDPLADHFKSTQAKSMVDTKNALNTEAKKFVRAEWIKHQLAYSGNKSEFARIYVRRVFNERQVKVTEKQMREVWLKDTPPAS